MHLEIGAPPELISGSTGASRDLRHGWGAGRPCRSVLRVHIYAVSAFGLVKSRGDITK